MKLWSRLLGEEAATKSSATTTTWKPLRIVARGMCCAVGHNAPAATAAINARMNHFRETEFVNAGDPIMGGAIYDVHQWGAERLQLMVQAVMTECLEKVPETEAKQVAVVLISAEAQRPGMPRDHLRYALQHYLDKGDADNSPFHAQSYLAAYGKGGIARAMEDAATLLNTKPGPTHVLMVAIDSLLDAAAIEQFLGQQRLSTAQNADGFIPAEGAAALLLSTAASQEPALWIDAVATAKEDWRLGSEAALRANGLTEVMRKAVKSANTEVAAMDFHASGMTGEGWYAKEVSLAVSRSMERKKAEFPHLMIARSVGETGAASPLLTLAWLAGMMGRSTGSPGASALLHFAGDDGQRSALVVRHRSILTSTS
jgi:3-oxoacyl-[acyl-carrier-protein] synthase I